MKKIIWIAVGILISYGLALHAQLRSTPYKETPKTKIQGAEFTGKTLREAIKNAVCSKEREILPQIACSDEALFKCSVVVGRVHCDQISEKAQSGSCAEVEGLINCLEKAEQGKGPEVPCGDLVDTSGRRVGYWCPATGWVIFW